MSTITITIPDTQDVRVADAFCAAYGWRSEAVDGPRADFPKVALMRYIVDTTTNIEAALAALAAPILTDVTPS